MASGQQKEVDILQGGELAELNRDVLSVVVHELGGIAGALDLRAAAMTKTAPDKDLSALRELAHELRVTLRAVRLLRDTDGSGTLAMSKPLPLAEWWRLASRLASMVLPRNVAIESQFSDGHLAPSQAAVMTWVWLAACKEIAERGLETPCSISVRGGASGSGDAVTLVAELPADRLSTAGTTPSRWALYAANVARGAGAETPRWTRDGAVMRWTCELPSRGG